MDTTKEKLSRLTEQERKLIEWMVLFFYLSEDECLELLKQGRSQSLNTPQRSDQGIGSQNVLAREP